MPSWQKSPESLRSRAAVGGSVFPRISLYHAATTHFCSVTNSVERYGDPAIRREGAGASRPTFRLAHDRATILGLLMRTPKPLLACEHGRRIPACQIRF